MYQAKDASEWSSIMVESVVKRVSARGGLAGLAGLAGVEVRGAMGVEGAGEGAGGEEAAAGGPRLHLRPLAMEAYETGIQVLPAGAKGVPGATAEESG